MDLDESGGTVPSFGTRATVEPKDFHRDLQRAVAISLEEGMNTKAIDLLCQVSYAGISTPAKPGAKKDVAIPPPEVLSILTTISLHPAFTTRRTGTLQLDAALRASRYIRTITRLAGPTNCRLQQAWRFKRSIDGAAASDDEANTTRRMRNRNVAKTGAVGRRGKRAAAADIDTAPFANLPIANEESLFRLSDDIWAVIGWAMVCSCRHPKRWDLWKDFLDLLLETLLADFQERIDAAQTPEDMDLEGSLANTIGFLPNMVGGAGYKRIVRAIFANRSDKSRNEWTPIFPKETKKPPKSNGIKDWQANLDSGLHSTNKPRRDDIYTAIRKNAEKMKDIRLNIDESSEAYQDFRAELARKGAFGDGFDADQEESEDEDHHTGDTQPDDKTKLETDEHAMEAWGGIDSIVIRLKLMSLVSLVGAARDLVQQKKQRQLAEEREQLARSRRKRKPSESPVPTATGVAEDTPETPQEHLVLPSTPVAVRNTEDLPPVNEEDTRDGDSTSSSSSRSLSPASSLYMTAYESSLNTPNVPSRILDLDNRSDSSSSLSAPPSDLSLSPPFPSSPYLTALDIIITSPPAGLDGTADIPPITPPQPFYLPPPPTDVPHLQPQAPQPNSKQISYLFAHDSETLECFYSEYVDCIRAMPLKQMILFTSPALYPAADIAFRASLLTRMLQTSMVWQPRNGWHSDLVTEDALRECYLPHHARGNDVESQVRMATLVECLARLWHVNQGIQWSEDLQAAVDAGIAARRERADAAVAKKKKKTPTPADKEMLLMLRTAEMRLRFLVQSAKNAASKEG
ncbi:hypothetical protein Dda_7708 [Drechslerella dactyloides]|uniref:Uncharacterized protein n=1 Tax=Drechslerella dactyloides TaxID=74499 RepID=A0AAD6NIK0_DREDA|nr:hypothetical protein Dda_7708 [Drechslerella dactyloides]